jgi:hypothetical protein
MGIGIIYWTLYGLPYFAIHEFFPRCMKVLWVLCWDASKQAPGPQVQSCRSWWCSKFSPAIALLESKILSRTKTIPKILVSEHRCMWSVALCNERDQGKTVDQFWVLYKRLPRIEGSFNTEWMSSHTSKVEKQNYKFESSRFHAMSLASKKRDRCPNLSREHRRGKKYWLIISKI